MQSLPIPAPAVLTAGRVRPPEPLGRTGRTRRGEGDHLAGFPPTFPRIVAGQAALFTA
jgi:hypothetical protein